MNRRLLFVACTVLLASTAAAQNLLMNPGFDLDPTNPANGWTTEGNGVLSHYSGAGDPAPPSARAETTDPQWLTLQQCIGVVAGMKYQFSARSFTNRGTGSATNSVSLSFFSSIDCTSGLLSNVPTDNGTFPGWYYRWADDVVAPPGAVAARIELAADGAGGVMDILWDDVIVQPDIDLFEDDFETGAIGGWSAMSCGNDPTPPGGTCPPECTGGCSGDVCIIDCSAPSSCESMDITCPPNFACDVQCTGDSSCDSASIHCAPNYACTVTCESADSCSYAAIYCSVSAPCELQCSGPVSSCTFTEQNCGLESCEATCTGGQFPDTYCGSACSCSECP